MKHLGIVMAELSLWYQEQKGSEENHNDKALYARFGVVAVGFQ